ncbi:MAG: type III-B CRISPR module-associated protein Cmr3 [Thermodesulfovibrio sp.]|nr:type III-B CRISPR module-associated protein Cmr3 [Thermodesulfovibrio sp.]
MWLKIVPNDTLFFRTGRPFSMGSETWAESTFPPYPSTIYGALRTFLLFQRGDLKSFKEKNYPDIGSPYKKGSMKIMGPFLVKDESLFFHAPFDLVRFNKELVCLKNINKPKIFLSDYKLDDLLLFSGKEKVENFNGFIDDILLKSYLEGREKNFSLPKNELYSLETKVGIARERVTLTSKEGYLYRATMIRLNRGVSIYIKVLDAELPKSGILQLGGEGKTAYFEELKNNPLENLEKIDIKLTGGFFKLYLATPAIFEKGWIPKWIDENTMEGQIQGIKTKLISCSIGRFIRLGGWDMAKKEPKTMRKAVPAGSVYYFKLLNDISTEDIKEIFHLKNISDINPEEGFGLSLVGGIR